MWFGGCTNIDIKHVKYFHINICICVDLYNCFVHICVDTNILFQIHTLQHVLCFMPVDCKCAASNEERQYKMKNDSIK